MDKKRAISIMTRAVRLYNENLEDQKADKAIDFTECKFNCKIEKLIR